MTFWKDLALYNLLNSKDKKEIAKKNSLCKLKSETEGEKHDDFNKKEKNESNGDNKE